jgi:kynurenine formamidase
MASEAWESTWSDIKERFNKLNANFKAVGKASDDYFAQLELAVGIQNPTLKAAEEEKNRSLKRRWIQAYRAAAESVGKMQSVQTDAADFQKVIASAAMREKIERNIQEARAIASRATEILSDLARLTAEGNKLIKS